MKQAIARAAALLGGQAAFARTLGITPSAVNQLVGGSRLTPPDRCPAIERATSGAVHCEQLRPDVRWCRVPDAAWPWHPDGRPLIDVAGQADTTTQEAERAA